MKCFASILILFSLALKFEFNAAANGTTNLPAPVSARDFFNAGTRLLAATNFTSAEQMFGAALEQQDEQVQPLAEYNLGQARFAEGMDILKKGPDAQKVSAQGEAVLAEGANAIQMARSALADNQLDKIVTAYIEGRGARKDLRTAEKAVQAAMDIYGRTLTKWQRAEDDFKGAAELNPADGNAANNAGITAQYIARLIDLIKKMEQMLGQMRGQDSELSKLLSQLKGQMPAPNAPPGGKGDDDDDDKKDGSGGTGDVTPESLIGKEEGGGGDGGQLTAPLLPDQAAQILDGLQIDGGRRLPMGGDKEGKPSGDRKGRNW
jgi:tetratricopeptide (TPR) repeat protein